MVRSMASRIQAVPDSKGFASKYPLSKYQWTWQYTYTPPIPMLTKLCTGPTGHPKADLTICEHVSLYRKIKNKF